MRRRKKERIIPRSDEEHRSSQFGSAEDFHRERSEALTTEVLHYDQGLVYLLQCFPQILSSRAWTHSSLVKSPKGVTTNLRPMIIFYLKNWLKKGGVSTGLIFKLLQKEKFTSNTRNQNVLVAKTC